MSIGTVKTQGTRLFFAVSTESILKVACPTGITGLGGPGGQIPTTCLDSVEMEYDRGMLDPGQLTVPINFIPRSAAHQALIELRETGEKISWMIVFSDYVGAGPTTVTAGRLVSPGETTAEFLAVPIKGPRQPARLVRVFLCPQEGF